LYRSILATALRPERIVVDYGIHGVLGRAFPGTQELIDLVGLLRVQILLEHNAQLLPQGLELLEILLVLALVLNLSLDAYSRISVSVGFPRVVEGLDNPALVGSYPRRSGRP
jgi:hypothetical protein